MFFHTCKILLVLLKFITSFDSGKEWGFYITFHCISFNRVFVEYHGGYLYHPNIVHCYNDFPQMQGICEIIQNQL